MARIKKRGQFYIDSKMGDIQPLYLKLPLNKYYKYIFEFLQIKNFDFNNDFIIQKQPIFTSWPLKFLNRPFNSKITFLEKIKLEFPNIDIYINSELDDALIIGHSINDFNQFKEFWRKFYLTLINI